MVFFPCIFITDLIVVKSGIEADIHLVSVTEMMGDLKVQVMEEVTDGILVVIRFAMIGDGKDRFQDQVNPTPAEAEHERGLSFYDRPFQRDPAIQKPQRPETMIMVEVTVFGSDVRDGRQSATISCGESTLIKVSILDDVRIERGEKSQGMIRLIERGAVEQEQVLVIVSSVYV
jgi:hypothetical protein